RFMQVVFRSKQRKLRLVTDNEDVVSGSARDCNEFAKAGVDFGKIHARAIDISLQRGEIVLAAGTVEEVANRIFGVREISRDQPALHGRSVKRSFVVHDRIVEINADAHSISLLTYRSMGG